MLKFLYDRGIKELEHFFHLFHCLQVNSWTFSILIVALGPLSQHKLFVFAPTVFRCRISVRRLFCNEILHKTCFVEREVAEYLFTPTRCAPG